MKKQLLILGCGYVGEKIARNLISKKSETTTVIGLTRSHERAKALQAAGIFPIVAETPLAISPDVLSSTTHLIDSIPLTRNGMSMTASQVDVVPQLVPQLSSLQWAGYLSTTGVYGDAQGAWVNEDTPCQPHSERGKERLLAEQAWLNSGVPAEVFRLAGIYGPERNIFPRLMAGNYKAVAWQPEHYASRIHVDDIVQALEAAIDHPRAGRILNIADDLPFPHSQYVQEVAAMIDAPAPIILTPEEGKEQLTATALSFFSDNKRISNQRLHDELLETLYYPQFSTGYFIHFRSLTMPIATLMQQLEEQLSLALAGKQDAIRQIMICLLSHGHILIEDVPGVGKTTLAHALTASLHSDFGRIQFTADMLPADIVGVEIFDPLEKRFLFHEGPIFHHIVLADEINRATPKAQSALLEAMAEGQVSIERDTHALPQPFFVMATQNPLEQLGTFPLPESQLDRFFMRISLGYPDIEAERRLLMGLAGHEQLKHLQALATWDDVQQAHHIIQALPVADVLMDYVLQLLAFSRNGKWLQQGISPRAGQDLLRAAKAHAWLNGQDYVSAWDIQAVWQPCLTHRIVAHGDASAAMQTLLEQVPVPA
ncbi:MAG: AAA family ATPase [Mariprofundaceae bacterium]|nr:AAA family ATPase [Mariprofundaceae bacterium]